MSVVIAAGGKQTRWTLPYPKQLAVVWEECLLDRLVRQFLPYSDEMLILADDPMIVERYPDNTWMPSDSRWLVESLYESRVFWDGRTIFLLGDTILTNRTVSRIAENHDYPIKFWGNSLDILAVTVAEEQQRTWELCLYAAARHAMFDGGRGKLWNAYRIYCGIDPGEDRHDTEGILTGTGDWSTDIDTAEQYAEFLRYAERERPIMTTRRV